MMNPPINSAAMTEGFLRLILPAEGHYCAVVFVDDKPQHHWRKTIPELASTLRLWNEQGFTVYHACASFKKPTRRKKDNVRLLKCLFFDIDPEGYADQDAMVAAVNAFFGDEGLPAPVIVNSGHGIHAYGILERALSREEWEEFANGIKERAFERGLKFDPVVTADAARILRPPGTTNRKNGVAKDVELISAGSGIVSLSQLHRVEGPARKGLVAAPVPGFFGEVPEHLKRLTPLESAAIPDEPANANKVADRCAQMRAMRDTRGLLTYPLWFGAIGVLTYCEGGEALAHEWSKGDPRYDAKQTQQKVDDWKANGDPATCEYFQGADAAQKCKDCPFRGRITSPVQLGRGEWADPVVTYNETLAAVVVEPEVELPKPEPVKPGEAPKLEEKGSDRQSPANDASKAPSSLADYIAQPAPAPVEPMPETVDLFGHSTREPELTRDMLPDAIADAAFDTSEQLGIEVAMVAIPMLAVCAAALHDSVKIQPKADDTEWTESARLWVAPIARPGTKKTASLAAAIKPLQKIEQEGRAAFKAAWAKYENDLEQQKADRKAGHAGPIPTKPTEKRLVVTDVTMEKLAHILAANDGGILYVVDELSGLIESYDKYRNKAGPDRAAALELNEGHPRSVDRVKDDGSIHVPNWSACKLGGIQPDKLKAMAPGLQTDGYFQRYLVFTGKNTLTDGEEVDRSPNEAAIKAYSAAIKALVATNRRPPGIEAEAPGPELLRAPIKLSPEAQVHRKAVLIISEKLSVLPSTPPALATHLAKWPGMFARLLLTFHAVECVSKGGAIKPVVPGATAKRARDLMLRFFLRHAVKIYAELFQPSDSVSDAQWIAGHILARGLESITLRDIRRAYTKLEKNEHAIEAAMEQLVSHGWITQRDRLQGGVKWTINPNVHTVYAGRAAEEKARREIERRKVAERTATVAEVL